MLAATFLYLPMGKSLGVLILSFTDFPNPTSFPADKKKEYTVSGFSAVTSIRLPEIQRQHSEASEHRVLSTFWTVVLKSVLKFKYV